MPVQRASPSEQIANELRARIEAGQYEVGKPLPSDIDLANEFDVSKPTVTKARMMLVALGLVESRAGAASIVRDVSHDPMPAGNRIQRARRTGRIYPEGHYARIHKAEIVSARADIAAALGIQEGSPAIERQRITYDADENPLSKSVTYFPGELAESCPRLLEPERIEQGTTLYIEQQTGCSANSTASAVWAQDGGAGPDSDAEQLGVPSATYLLVVATTTYDGAGTALAYELELHPPETRIALDVTAI